MQKQKNYLVYDGDETPAETGSLREQFEKENQIQEPPQKSPKKTKEENPTPKPATSKKKIIERFLIGLIVVVIILMIGTVALLLGGNTPPTIVTPNDNYGRLQTNILGNPSERQVFSYISQNNQAIITYFADVRETIVNNPEQLKTKATDYKKEVIADIDIFSSYRQIYVRYGGEALHDIYTERILNAFDLIKSVSEAESNEQAIQLANRFINRERELNTRAISALIV